MAEVERRRRRLRHGAPTDGNGGEPPADTSGLAPDRQPETTDQGSSARPERRPANRPASPGTIERRGGGAPERGQASADELSAETPVVHDPELEGESRPGGRAGGGRNGAGNGGNGDASGDDRETERGLRGLVGSGASQVSLSAAMRARDAARPTDADLAAADTDLTIVRRGWVPREDLPRLR